MSDEWGRLARELGLTLRPISEWPGTMTRDRVQSSFRATLSQTLKDLSRELWTLDARDSVLEIAIQPGCFRLDGMPRADAKAEHPGVILSFVSRHGALMYPCDRFTLWQHNLRAISLSLEALRMVDRYGVTKHGEQYTGFAALPAGDGATAPPGGPREIAAVTLWRAAGEENGDWRRVLADTLVATRTYREAMKRTHPDAGGTSEAFRRVTEAARVLGIR